MSQSIQARRGTTAQADALTLLPGESYFDTTLKQLRLHDGATAGGNKVALLNAQPRVTLASAATVSIGAANAETVIVSGTTSISSLGVGTDGVTRRVMFTGALTLTNNATSLILPGGADIATTAGDVAEFICLGASNWQCVLYVSIAGTVRGSNANGDYVKYPDGRLECSLNVASVSIAVTSAYSPLFYGQPALWTFPVPFVGAMPYVGLTPYCVGKLSWATRSASVSLSSAQFAVLDIASATSTYQLSYIAIGRWK